MKRFVFVLGGAALLASCSDDPALYLGGPPGPLASLQLSTNRLDLRAGHAATFAVQGRDAVGNPVTVTATAAACNAKVSVAIGASSIPSWSQDISVTANDMGESCVTVTAESLTETVLVALAPASIVITGPAAILSGNIGQFQMAFYHADGSALTAGADFQIPKLVSTNEAILALTAVDPLTYDGGGQLPGAVTVQVATSADTRVIATDVHALTISPGVFAGTLSAASAVPAERVTATRAAAGPAFDADSKARLGTVNAFVDAFTANTLTFVVPAIGSTAEATLLLSDMGPLQFAHSTTFTATKADEDVHSPDNLNAACAPAVTAAPSWNTDRSPGGWIYLTHRGSTQGTRGACNGSTGVDHYITYTTGAAAETISVRAEWTVVGDNDILVCEPVFTPSLAACPGQGFSGENLVELGAADVALAPNTTYWIIFSPWTGAAGNNQIRIRIE